MAPFSRETGELALAGGVIGPRTTRAAFAAAHPRFTDEGRSRERIDGEPWLVMVRFAQQRLAGITLIRDDARFGSGWDDYDEEKEQARRAAHDAFVERALGPATTVDDAHFFKEWVTPWGKVRSAHDPRGGTTDVQVLYALTDT